MKWSDRAVFCFKFVVYLAGNKISIPNTFDFDNRVVFKIREKNRQKVKTTQKVKKCGRKKS